MTGKQLDDRFDEAVKTSVAVTKGNAAVTATDDTAVLLSQIRNLLTQNGLMLMGVYSELVQQRRNSQSTR